MHGLGADLLDFADPRGRSSAICASCRAGTGAAVDADPGRRAERDRRGGEVGRARFQPSGDDNPDAASGRRVGGRRAAARRAMRPLGVMVVGRSGRAGFSADEVAFVERARRRLRTRAGAAAAAGADRQILRRRSRTLRVAGTEVHAGRMRIDLEHLRIEVDGRSAHLTPTEMRLLMFLADEPGRPRSRGRSSGISGRATTSAASARVTRTSGTCGARSSASRRSPELVVTRRGVGYALDVVVTRHSRFLHTRWSADRRRVRVAWGRRAR